jgi:hypothetical protein
MMINFKEVPHFNSAALAKRAHVRQNKNQLVGATIVADASRS